MTKRGKLTILGLLILSVVLLTGISFYRSPQGGKSDLAGVPVQGVEAIADYHLIPIINAQSTDIEQVYLNTEATPSLFFATWSDQSEKQISAVQDKLKKMGAGTHKPLVLVSTFVKTTDQAKAITEVKEFVQKDNITLPIAVQVGPPTEYVKQVPSLVYTDEKGTHIVTEQSEILDSLDSILTFQTSQPTTPQPTEEESN